MTVSLGLKQIKPKVSYNESVLNLKKKQQTTKLQKPTTIDDGDLESEEPEKFVVVDRVEDNLNETEMVVESTISKPKQEMTMPSVGSFRNEDLNSVLKKLTETLHMKIEEKEKQLLRSTRTTTTTTTTSSNASKSTNESLSVAPSQESGKTVKTTSENNRQLITVDLETIHCLKEDIKKISDNFKVLHEIIVEKNADGKKIKRKKSEPEVAGESLKSSSAVASEVKTDKNFSSPLKSGKIQNWMDKIYPEPHPYNVFTAFRHKLNIYSSKSSLTSVEGGGGGGATTTTTTTTTEDSSTTYFKTTNSHKEESDFEGLSTPSSRLITEKKTRSFAMSNNNNNKTKTEDKSPKKSYFTTKEDSGSELSSSILDSDKMSSINSKMKDKTPPSPPHPSHPPSLKNSSSVVKSNELSLTSSVLTEMTPKSLEFEISRDSIATKVSSIKFSKGRENLVLITPDVKLVSNELSSKKLRINDKNFNFYNDATAAAAAMTAAAAQQIKSSRNSWNSSYDKEELNNSDTKSYREQKTDSTITEMIHNLSESDKPTNITVKATNEKFQNVVQKLDDVHLRRPFFQPEMLHLQFQAELTLLETFQQSLTHFLEAERLKTLSEVTKIVNENKNANVVPERVTLVEDQAVQTTFLDENPTEQIEVTNVEVETEYVKTEIDASDDEESTIYTTENFEKDEEEIKTMEIISHEKISKESSKETNEIRESSGNNNNNNSNKNNNSSSSRESEQKVSDVLDFSNEPNCISFQMLNRMMKDEELRSEHQLALIRLREKTLNEKVKAELTFLEMKKRALKKGNGNDEEQNISAIKKKQRGILMKFQSEKEEIERLKKMHKIASEERKIMIKQQKQIQKMQISTKDMLTKLKRKDKIPLKKNNNKKPKGNKNKNLSVVVLSPSGFNLI